MSAAPATCQADGTSWLERCTSTRDSDVVRRGKQVQQLRLVHRLEKEAERALMDTETMQGRRWELLRRVAGYAGDSYTAMRIDVVDERLRDQGAPTWLGAMLTIGVTLIPVTALTGGFLAGLT